MNEQRLRRIDELFEAALELPLERRLGFLKTACDGDTELRDEVESLLSAHDAAGDFIEDSASDVATSLLENQRPKQVGQYKIERLLGAGGMGEVYLAEDTRLNRKVAIKFLTPTIGNSEQGHRRLLREARAAAKLDHPNVCAIYEVSDSGRTFIVMPYIEGETLDLRLKRKPLERSEALAIAAQVADALAEAHAHRVIHRDIKPSNIIITSRGQAKVMDFGLAKITGKDVLESEADKKSLLTTPGLIIGTLPYMSPEQVRGEELDERSDIFSFGVVLYEMLTGRQPFACDNVAATAAAILTTHPKLAQLSPGHLQVVVDKCLAKDLTLRYQTMREVADDLHRAALELPFTEQAKTQAAKVSNETATRNLNLRSLLLAAALVVVAIAGTIVLLKYFRPTPVQSSSRLQIQSLAVLPFNNLSGDPAQEYFADGMTESVISSLGRISALRVISRTSVMKYKTEHKSLPEIGRELNVDAIVEGSVRRFGDQVSINVNLIRADADQQIWTQTYNRDLRNVLVFQSEVAGAISKEIQVTLTPQEQARLSSGREVNSEAYDNYLQGKFHATLITESENKAAIGFLEHSVALDPNFAAGYAELARAYTRRLNSFAPEEPQWEKKALNAVEKALLLDPDLAEAHLAHGLLLWTHSNKFPHEQVVEEYRKALQLNPNLDEAHHQLCVVYLHVGLFDEALKEIKMATAINPSNTYAQYRLGTVYLYQGKADDALAIFQKFQDALAPSYSGYQAVWALFELGRKDEALKSADETLRRDPEDAGGANTSMLAILVAAAGDRRKAEALIKTAQSKEKGFIHFHHTAYNIACAYALMNRAGDAVDWLQKAADDGLPCYSLFLRDHNLDSIRQDLRFISFMGKQKEQWEYYKAKL